MCFYLAPRLYRIRNDGCTRRKAIACPNGLNVHEHACTPMAQRCAAFTTSLNSSNALYAACASWGFTDEYKKLGTGELPMTPLIALYTSMTLEVATDAMAF